MTLQRPESQQVALEQVGVRIGDDDIRVSWDLPHRASEGQSYAARARLDPLAVG